MDNLNERIDAGLKELAKIEENTRQGNVQTIFSLFRDVLLAIKTPKSAMDYHIKCTSSPENEYREDVREGMMYIVDKGYMKNIPGHLCKVEKEPEPMELIFNAKYVKAKDVDYFLVDGVKYVREDKQSNPQELPTLEELQSGLMAAAQHQHYTYTDYGAMARYVYGFLRALGTPSKTDTNRQGA